MENFVKEIDPSAQRIYTVTEFNTEVNELLNQYQVLIQGEVSGYKVIQNKYVRFDIKDQGSVLGCFMTLWQLNFQIEDGMEIKVHGRPGLYVPQGRYTFRVDSVEPVGAGALRRAFELTKAKLEKEGLFDPKFKKPLPRFPEKLGLVTSTDAAAYTDVLKILNARWQGLEIVVYHTLVQGIEAPAKIVQALDHFNKFEPVDVIILTRGGGSLEDLQAFNSESVCRAVFASKIPIICGIGHERDTCLAEMVADRRASTPTNAAQLAVPEKTDVIFQLGSHTRQLGREMEVKISREQDEISSFLDRLNSIILDRINLFQETRHHLAMVFQKFGQQVVDYRRDLQLFAEAVASGFHKSYELAATNLKNQLNLMESLSPMKVLQRGYSITYSPSGKSIRSVKEVKAGDRLRTRLADGEIISDIKNQLKLEI